MRRAVHAITYSIEGRKLAGITPNLLFRALVKEIFLSMSVF